MPSEPTALLCEIDRPEAVTAIRHALTAAGIPYQSGLQATDPARVVLFVPWARLDEAQRVVQAYLTVDDDPELRAFEEDGDSRPRPRPPASAIPWSSAQAVASLVLLHLGLVFWAGSSLPSSPNLVQSGGIVQDLTAGEPWRIFTAMFVHVDPSHVLWNGVSLLVFAVPLLGALGYRRTASIYMAAGLGGGVTAYAFLEPGSVVVGSSGAVAGLFGAWVVQAWQRGARDSISWRGKIRSLGIAALVLPSLISPVNAAGHAVSVASHLGGLLTGMLVGALISRRFKERREPGPLLPFQRSADG